MRKINIGLLGCGTVGTGVARMLLENRDLIAETGLNPFKQWIARTFIARPAYFRIIADYEGTIVDGGVATPVKGECLYEIMGLM